jgi:hypothetical protein
MKKIILALLGCGAAITALAQDISLRHDLEGKALDTWRPWSCASTTNRRARAGCCCRMRGDWKTSMCCRTLPCSIPTTAWISLAPGRAFGRLHEVMREAGQKFDAGGFYPQIADAVDDASGRIQALPLALSLPVLLTNRAALRKAGLDPDQPVKTWWDLQKVAGADL